MRGPGAPVTLYRASEHILVPHVGPHFVEKVLPQLDIDRWVKKDTSWTSAPRCGGGRVLGWVPDFLRPWRYLALPLDLFPFFVYLRES